MHQGQHAPIVDRDLWDRVQARLSEHLGAVRIRRSNRSSDALLAGKLYDDRGNRMSPTWARKGPKRWRYYVSQAALQGDKAKAGSMIRVPAAEIESQIVDAIATMIGPRARAQGHHAAMDLIEAEASSQAPSGIATGERRAEIRALIDQVTLSRTSIRIALSESVDGEGEGKIISLSWTPSSPYRRREIIQSVDRATTTMRPMRANARRILIDSLRKAHRWLDELIAEPRQSIATLAAREGKTERSILMTLSLAFLAPDLVKAAVEGRLPRGVGLKRLVDLPIGWSEQWQAIGLEAPGHA